MIVLFVRAIERIWIFGAPYDESVMYFTKIDLFSQKIEKVSNLSRDMILSQIIA